MVMLRFAVATGRAGWVGTRNFEVDSGAYYLSLLFNFHSAVGRARAADTLTRPEVPLCTAIKIFNFVCYANGKLCRIPPNFARSLERQPPVGCLSAIHIVIECCCLWTMIQTLVCV